MLFSSLILWQDDASAHEFIAQDFDPARWRSHASCQPLHGGRGGSMRIQLEDQDCVLRQYLRGGMIARLLTDRYLWTGLKSTRPYRETRMVQRALRHGLPVAPVLAYRVIRSGLYYRAAIISRYIHNQGTLAQCLQGQLLDGDGWVRLGRVIRSLHAAGIYHADLNANNILVDASGDFHLIDFDRARLLASPTEGEKNLDRLLRSLQKIHDRQLQHGQSLHFRKGDWKQLLAGYGSTR